MNRYNRKGWPLTVCEVCAVARYCEPHGVTAACKNCARWTYSVSIPYKYGDLQVRITVAERRKLVEL